MRACRRGRRSSVVARAIRVRVGASADEGHAKQESAGALPKRVLQWGVDMMLMLDRAREERHKNAASRFGGAARGGSGEIIVTQEANPALLRDEPRCR